jgi:hypothetical protein
MNRSIKITLEKICSDALLSYNHLNETNGKGVPTKKPFYAAVRDTCVKSVNITGRQLPPLSSVLYRIISKRRNILAAQLLLREKSGA